MKTISITVLALIAAVMIVASAFLSVGCAAVDASSPTRGAIRQVTGEKRIELLVAADENPTDIVNARYNCTQSSGFDGNHNSGMAAASAEILYSALTFGAGSFGVNKRRARSDFCSCMFDHGWRCDGYLSFQDVNAAFPNNPDGFTPLLYTVTNDNYDTVSWLISQGADVNTKDDLGRTPLHLASWVNAVNSARVLINHSANIEAKANNDTTPLSAAALKDNYDVAELLVKHGAKVNAESDDGLTPLHVAARYNAGKVAGLLIAEGANLETPGGDEGLTPLHRAALFASVEVADLLIARGANLNATSYSGETPLDIARREKKRDVIALLERAARVAAQKTQAAADDENKTALAVNKAEIVFESAWRSVVVVIAGNSQGGGVVVNEPNRVATNCHVVDKSPNDIRVYKGENRHTARDVSYPAKIIAGDRERDICILAVPGLWAIPAKIKPAANLAIGEQVFAVGAPHGLDFSISGGVVSQLRSENGDSAPLIQTDAAISPGSSGGGLFDAQGNLVGITTWKVREGENLNFAHPIEWALEL
jgi:ankyrin repeat protein